MFRRSNSLIAAAIVGLLSFATINVPATHALEQNAPTESLTKLATTEGATRLIVKYKPGVSPVTEAGAIVGAERVPNEELRAGVDLGMGMRSVLLAEPATESEAEQIVAQLETDPRIEWVEVDRVMFASSLRSSPRGVFDSHEKPARGAGENTKALAKSIASKSARQVPAATATPQTLCNQAATFEPISRCFPDSAADAGDSLDAEIVWANGYVRAATPTKLIVDIVPLAAISDDDWLTYGDTWLEVGFDTDGDDETDVALVPQWDSVGVGQSIPVNKVVFDGTDWVEADDNCGSTVTRKLGDHAAITGTSNSWWQISTTWSCLVGTATSNVRFVTYLEDYYAYDLAPDYYTGTPISFSTLVAGSPSITTISPASGPAAGGTRVTITGTNLAGTTSVRFGELAATIVSKAATTLVVTSPAGMPGPENVTVQNAVASATKDSGFTYQSGAVGQSVSLSVTNPDGTTSRSSVFTYTAPAPPTITAVSPVAGPADGGNTITLTGTAMSGISSVTVGGLNAIIVSKTSTSVVLSAPPSVAGTVAIAATSVAGTAHKPAAYRFVASPAMLSLSATTGSTVGGQTVVISGSNFNDATAVRFGATTAAIVSKTDGSITVTTPARSAGVVDVVVTSLGGIATMASAFAYSAPATITSVSPITGTTLGGTTVTISGTNLSNASTVTFGGTSGTIVSKNATTIVVTTPARSAGASEVAIVTPASRVARANGYTFVAPPLATITTVSPTFGSALGGTLVTITGTAMSDVTEVKFGTTAATIVSKTATSVIVTAPAVTAGVVSLSMTNTGGTTVKAAAFEFRNLPTVTDMTPNQGSTPGGNNITITGTNLAATSTVTFGGTAGTIVSKNATTVVVRVPAGTAGVKAVIVTTPAGTATVTGGYTFYAPPTITTVSPTTGSIAGGTQVTITGTNLSAVTNVTLGAIEVTPTTKTSTTIRFITPATNLSGSRAVTVVSPGGTATRNAAFGYTLAAVRSLTPVAATPSSGAALRQIETTTDHSPRHIMERARAMTAVNKSFHLKPPATMKPQKATTRLIDMVSPQSNCTATAAVEPYSRCYTDYEDTWSYDADIFYTAAYVKAASPTVLTVDTVPLYPITDSNWLLYGDTGMAFTFDTDGDGSADVYVFPVARALAANASTSIQIVDYDSYYDDYTARTATCSGTVTRKAADHSAIAGTSNSWWQLNVNWSCLFAGNADNVTFTTFLEDYFDYDFAPDYFDELPAGNLNSITEPGITSLSPSSGPTAGGTNVTITGKNLATATQVTFDGVPGTIVSRAATTLVVRTPAHSAGYVDVEVSAPNGYGYLESAFNYVASPPVINSLSVISGTADGGTSVVITGSNLGNATQVQLGGQNAQIVSKTSTTITFITPPAPSSVGGEEPTDPRYVDGSLWGLDGEFGIDAPTAWDTTHGSPNIVVAVIDTGRTIHTDEGLTVAGYDMVSLDDTDGDGFDDSPLTANDGNGRDSDPSDPGDWISTNEASGTAANGWFEGCEASNSSWHGTHVAGTVNAASNASGIVGIAPGVKVQHVRVLGKCGGYMSDIIAGITWASGGTVAGVPTNTTPARVINMSLGGGGSCSSAMQSAINGAVARGTTVVVAAGNESMDARDSNPANCFNVVVVGASDSDGRRASFSNYGPIVDLAGPGVDILSTINLGRTNPTSAGYASYSGTSMATPHVAGVVALMLSANAGLTPGTVEAILKSTAGPFGGARCDPVSSVYSCGAGIANAGAAVVQ